MKKRLIYLVTMLAAAVAAGIIYYHVPDRFKFKCLFFELTGLYCPGCGTTRLCMNLMRFDIKGAFRSNCGLFVCSPIIVTFFAMRAWGYIKTGVPAYTRAMKVMAGVSSGLLLIFGVLRNIPCFGVLRP